MKGLFKRRDILEPNPFAREVEEWKDLGYRILSVLEEPRKAHHMYIGVKAILTEVVEEREKKLKDEIEYERVKRLVNQALREVKG